MKTVGTALLRLGVYYMLLFFGVLLCGNFVPDSFPLRNLSTLYYLILSACLIRYYSYRMPAGGNLSFAMRFLSWMAFALLLLRGLKYSVFAGVDILARHIWYLYYLPMLLLPLCFFYVSLLISPRRDNFAKKWLWSAVLTAGFILLVLTNDLHGLVFRFKPGFENWDGDYTRGLLFYIITAWQYILYLAAVAILVIKCRVGSAKKSAWLTLIPFLSGAAMNLLLATNKMPRLNGAYIIEFPEALIFMVAGVLECCMQLGLIPTNKNYGKLFAILSLCAQITDKNGVPVFISRTAVPLTEESFLAPDGARIAEHTVLHKMELPGGYGFWQDDMTGLDRLNAELSEAKEALAQEAELTRLENELKEKQIKIEQRTAVYDAIAAHTLRQSREISALAKRGRLSNDLAVKKKCGERVVLLAAFVKRYANLMLLSYENEDLETGELALSFSEVLRYLNFAGVPGELVDGSCGTVRSNAALAVFRAFGALLTEDIDRLRGVFINLSRGENTVCKLTLENTDGALLAGDLSALSAAGVACASVTEDGVAYITLTLPERRRSQ